VISIILLSGCSSDEEATAAFENMLQFYAENDSFFCSMQVTDIMRIDGDKSSSTSRYSLQWKRDVGIRVLADDPSQNCSFAHDGDSLYFHEQPRNYFNVRAAAVSCNDYIKSNGLYGIYDDLAPDLHASMERIRSAPFFLDDLMLKDAVLEATSHIRGLRNKGTQKVNGVICTRIAVEETGVDGDPFTWYLWIEDSDTPFVRRISGKLQDEWLRDLGRFLDDDGNLIEDMTRKLEVEYDDWTVGPQLTDESFRLSPPEGAEVFIASRNNPEDMIGEPAPDFELPAVDGEVHSLSERLGPGPAVLHFSKLDNNTFSYEVLALLTAAEKWRQGDIQVVVVMNDESVPEVLDYFKRMRVDIEDNACVFMDRDGAIHDLYGVTYIGLALTCIVDKRGVVQSVWYAPVTETREYIADMTQRLQEIDDGVFGQSR